DAVLARDRAGGRIEAQDARLLGTVGLVAEVGGGPHRAVGRHGAAQRLEGGVRGGGERLQRGRARRGLLGGGALGGGDADQRAVLGVVGRRRRLRAGARIAGGEGQAGAVGGRARREVDGDVAAGGDDPRAGAVGRDGEGQRRVRRDRGRHGGGELRRR